MAMRVAATLANRPGRPTRGPGQRAPTRPQLHRLERGKGGVSHCLAMGAERQCAGTCAGNANAIRGMIVLDEVGQAMRIVRRSHQHNRSESRTRTLPKPQSCL